MLTHKQLRIAMLALLIIVTGMVATEKIWLGENRSPFIALAYWGLCALLILMLIGLAFADIRFLKIKYLRGKSKLLEETLTDEAFTQKLKEKKLKVVIEKPGTADEPGQKDENTQQSPERKTG